MKKEVVDFIRQTLTDNVQFLVLRGHDLHARPDGDIDVLVPRGKAVLSCLLVAKSAREQGWYVLGFRDIGYLASIVLISPQVGGHDVAIKIDFFSGLEWYGVGTGTVSDSFFKDILPEAQARDELGILAATVNFYQKCMAVGHLSQRDWGRVIDGGATGDYLLKIAAALQLPLNEKNVAENGLGRFDKWRFRIASASVGNLWTLIVWFIQVCFAHLRFKFRAGFCSGHIFGFSGLDGSGKSTQVDRLLLSFKKSGMCMPRQIHLLPKWIPLPHQIIRRNKTIKNYTNPYSEPPVTSRLSGALRLTYYLAAFFTAKIFLQLSAKRGTVWILDRCFADFIADLSRARIPEHKLPSWLLNTCVPVGCLIYLDASASTVVQRKGELTVKKATELRLSYLEIFSKINGHIVDGEKTPDEVYVHILELIDTVYFKRLGIPA